MKFFLDTANVDEIRDCLPLGFVDGVTTNPSLISKTGRPFEEVAKEICEMVDGPVSLEVVSTEAEAMIEEGRKLAAIAPNVVVKLPTIKEGLKALKVLSDEGIRVNMTLIFQAVQALLAARNGAAYVSPFVGRIDDITGDGMQLIADIATIFDQYAFETEILVASVRGPKHVVESAMLGADVVTLPPKVLDKLIQHPLTTKGLQQFLADWNKHKEVVGV